MGRCPVPPSPRRGSADFALYLDGRAQTILADAEARSYRADAGRVLSVAQGVGEVVEAQGSVVMVAAQAAAASDA
jgi:hypothetical protein